jgi:hypothetical protein
MCGFELSEKPMTARGTTDKHRGIRNFLWRNDNQHILYTQELGGDENWRLYRTDIATKQTRDLTPFEKVRVDIVAC